MDAIRVDAIRWRLMQRLVETNYQQLHATQFYWSSRSNGTVAAAALAAASNQAACSTTGCTTTTATPFASTISITIPTNNTALCCYSFDFSQPAE